MGQGMGRFTGFNMLLVAVNLSTSLNSRGLDLLALPCDYNHGDTVLQVDGAT